MIDVPKGLSLWLHIAAAAVLVGGALYARLAMQAGAVTLTAEEAFCWGLNFCWRRTFSLRLCLLCGQRTRVGDGNWRGPEFRVWESFSSRCI